MNGPSPLATFTPSLVDPEILEKLFVGRERIASDLVDRVRSAANTRSRAHRMIVGPRGAGKTHLIAIAHHRIASIEDVQIAWLPEDPWTIDSYTDFLLAILGGLQTIPKANASAHVPSTEQLEGTLRKKSAEDGLIVVLAENFDQILELIGEQGQRQLRSFLENDAALLLIVTATKLVDSVMQQTAPFYGFFSKIELQPFSITEARQMLAGIAEYRGEADLAERLRDPNSRWVEHRLQAIDSLAGGQPRVWALLAGSLTIDGLSELANALLQRLDDLVPYYQEQLGRLSPRERKAVRRFAEDGGALNVKQLATVMHADDKSVGKTVTELDRKGWIRRVNSQFLELTDARRTYYELSEPMARLAFQIKDNRGEALPVLVSFLSAWFSTTDLQSAPISNQRLVTSAIEASLSDGTRAYDVARVFVEKYPSQIQDPMLLLIDEALHAIADNDPGPYFALESGTRRILEEQISRTSLFETRVQIVQAGSMLGPWVDRTERFARSLVGAERDSALMLHGIALYRAALYEESKALFKQVLVNRAHHLGPGHPDTLDTRFWLVVLNGNTGDQSSNQVSEFVAEVTRVLGPRHQTALDARSYLATVHIEAGETATARKVLQKLLKDQTSVYGTTEHLEVLATRHYLAICDLKTERYAKARKGLEGLTKDSTKFLGASHPFTMAIRNSLAGSYRAQSQTEDALLILRAIASDTKRVLGPTHPNTLAALRNLALVYSDVGKLDEALAILKVELADMQHTLGPDHESTLRVQKELDSIWLKRRGTSLQRKS
jgi:tetratricopeptide (TPR) repeat protein